MSNKRIHIGSSYYPEHWDESHWANDIRLMKEAGFTVARMAEFAWSTMEPVSGEFRFDWLEKAIAQLADAGLVTVLGTPTAAPPAWLIQQHPDMLAVDENGRRVQFGNRCHYCVNSPEFHEATRRIVAAMGERFGKNPHIIGWQLDNEYNRVCHCERCQKLFQGYLKDKFGSLDVLNDHWSTAYWSQTYSDWEQIPLPVGPHNPGLMLEFKRFVTESYRKFQKLQIDTLRPCLSPEIWITHNFMGWFDGLDHYKMSEDLDMVSWDWYVGSGYHDHLSSGAIHDLTRGFKRKNFWLIETQPGNVNWSPINNVVNKGEARAMAWHAVAHGADAVLYWQWRSAPGGQEQYHGTLVDQSGQPRPFYEEAKQLADDFAKSSDLLETVPAADVALLNSYDDRWSIHAQRHHKDFDYVKHFNHYYRALSARNIAAHVLPVDASLDGYKLVIAPALLMLDQARAEKLKTYVENGGHLVLTVRSGMKDDFNALLPLRQPGPLAEAAGVEVEEYYALLDPVPVAGGNINGESRIWAEWLKVRDTAETRIVARYGASNGWLDGQAAITTHAFGKGCVTYVGAWLDEVSQQNLLDDIVRSAGVMSVMECPVGVEARKRVNVRGDEIFILINHTRIQKKVKLPWRAHEHLSGMDVNDLLLGPYHIAVITHKEKVGRS